MDGTTLRLEAKNEWEPLTGPGEGVDREETYSLLNKGLLHGLKGRGRRMVGAGEEDKMPGWTQWVQGVKVLRQGNADFPGRRGFILQRGHL